MRPGGTTLAAAFVLILAFAAAPASPTPTAEAASCAPRTPFAYGNLTVEMLSVGKGESMVLHHRGRVALVDVGSTANFTRDVLPHLRADRVCHLHAVVLSHSHLDHSGGCDALLGNVTVGTLYVPRQDSFLPHWKPCLDKARALGTQIRSEGSIRLNATYAFFPGLPTRFLSVNHTSDPHFVDRSVNEGSLVFRIAHGSVSVMFMGDAYCSTENRILARGYPVRADVLKMGHHGLASSSCDAWLRAVGAQLALVGDPKPPPSTVQMRLDAAGLPAYTVGLEGNMTFTTDGAAWTFHTEKGGAAPRMAGRGATGRT